MVESTVVTILAVPMKVELAGEIGGRHLGLVVEKVAGSWQDVLLSLNKLLATGG